MRRTHGWCGLGLALMLLGAGAGGCDEPPPLDLSGPVADWPVMGGDAGGLQFSPLTQVTPDNVDRLEVAWVHHSGDFWPGGEGRAPTALEAVPLVVHDTLYYCTPYSRIFALDPETGAERWVFDPEVKARGSGGPYPQLCRGISYWEAEQPEAGVACQRRILFGTKDSELLAVDADTGRPCREFGDQGRVWLRAGLGEMPDWEYHPNSPPLVIGDLAVIGALVADQLRVDAPAGVVRAFDVRTGALVWAWDPVPPGWQGPLRDGERYTRGTPNVWSLLSGDAERGLVFVPMGNASPDSYGGERRGLDYYASSVVALDARTGAVVWHFQTVHHDVWDYDVPARPVLIEIPGVGGGRPAVVVATKMGHLFVLDRETGEPLLPVEERPVPQDGVPGETLSATQPFPERPAPIHPLELSPESAFGFTPLDRAECRRLIARHRYDGIFTPPTLEGSIQYPHSSGGMNWGGVAIDPRSGLLYTNQTHVAMVVQLIPRAEYDALDTAGAHYPIEYYPMRGTPYGVKRFGLFSSFGAPCNPPPWGSLSAVDLRSGDLRWQVPLGTTRDQAPFPAWFRLGTPNFGGSLLTASGLVFIGATTDKFLRAFEAGSGEQIWRARLPFTAHANPISYRLRPDARQFVVIAAGGFPVTEVGDALIAYALPRSETR